VLFTIWSMSKSWLIEMSLLRRLLWLPVSGRLALICTCVRLKKLLTLEILNINGVKFLFYKESYRGLLVMKMAIWGINFEKSKIYF